MLAAVVQCFSETPRGVCVQFWSVCMAECSCYKRSVAMDWFLRWQVWHMRRCWVGQGCVHRSAEDWKDLGSRQSWCREHDPDVLNQQATSEYSVQHFRINIKSLHSEGVNLCSSLLRKAEEVITCIAGGRSISKWWWGSRNMWRRWILKWTSMFMLNTGAVLNGLFLVDFLC